MAAAPSSFEAEVTAVGRRIAELGGSHEAGVYRMSWWSERLLDWAMRRPDFKTQLFRFVDAFPALSDDRDVLRHLDEYFDGASPAVVQAALEVADRVPSLGARISASIARSQINRMGGQFIVGEGPDGALERLHELWVDGSAFTVDLLGEKTLTEVEADAYESRVHELIDRLVDAVAGWPDRQLLEESGSDRIPRINVSVKATALAPHFTPLARRRALDSAAARLASILRHAGARGAFVNVDMEHDDVKDLTLDLFRRVLSLDEFVAAEAGIVIQAYRTDSFTDLADLVSWSTRRSAPITVRLVKGAYWDTETVLADAAGWPSPVYRDKARTDENYERCARLLLDHATSRSVGSAVGVRPAFGTHNLRSMAYVVAYADRLGLPADAYELQMLYGMAEPTQAAVRALGRRLRVYCPIGELVPGMAYLVRRLLENTSNESFLRHRYVEHDSLDQLLAAPCPGQSRGDPRDERVRREPTDADDPAEYQPEPLRQWRLRSVRAAMAAAVDGVDRRLARHADRVPAVIGGEEIETTTSITSVDPGRFERVVAVSASCGSAEADQAVARAVAVAEQWRRTPARRRAEVLFGAAHWMAERRDELAALEVFEAGKPWAEADADVAEAVDFCEYYGREALRLDRGGAVQSPPAEANHLRYQGKGPTAVIAPWNFPLAIPTGMTAAALAVGNPVVLKPAEQTPAIAWQLVSALRESGLPDGVLGFVPGPGETVGARLVEHPDIVVVVFTGSLAVGLSINASASEARPGQRHVKRVIAEMGGKNALIVDSDADLDQAIPGALHAAFGYGGQKCSAASRLVVHDAVYDDAIARLVAAADLLTVGHPSDPGVDIGPVIDADSHARLQGVIAEIASGSRGGRLRWQGPSAPDHGWYVPPSIVDEVAPDSSLARDELFGPVLTVFRVESFSDAVRLANDTDFALTAGVFSRSPAHLREAATSLRAGNVYLNRGTTGAVVGRQPFGGHGLSGVGSKAGGPDYLLQFVDPVTVTENTLRQGFAPQRPASG